MINNFTVNFAEERVISFVLKLHAGILPCNFRQFCWGSAKFFQCSLCDQTDDNIHFAMCNELQNDLKDSLFEVVEKCPIIREKIALLWHH